MADKTDKIAAAEAAVASARANLVQAEAQLVAAKGEKPRRWGRAGKPVDTSERR